MFVYVFLEIIGMAIAFWEFLHIISNCDYYSIDLSIGQLSA